MRDPPFEGISAQIARPMILTVTSTAAPSVALASSRTSSSARTRARNDARLLWRARLAFALSGGGAAVGAILCALFLHGGPAFSAWRLALFVGLYALVSRVEFEIGSGSAIPTQLVLVPMLFALPIGARAAGRRGRARAADRRRPAVAAARSLARAAAARVARRTRSGRRS